MAYPATNLPIDDIADTMAYFAQVYDRPIEITQNVIDALYAFFISRTENKDAAMALVNSVLVTSLNERINPMTLLDDFRALGDDFVLDAHLANFLNTSRNNTSMLGVINVPRINHHIARTILT